MESAHESLTTVELASGGTPVTAGGVSTSNSEAHMNGNINNQQEHQEGDDSRRVVMSAPEGDNTALRQGTISSARFNILCTMVGGGVLSLPMAFQKTGNGLFGPFLSVVTAMITEFCFRIIIASTRRLSPVRESTTVIGKDSFETLASFVFGEKHGFLFGRWLVIAMCYFGSVVRRF